MLGECIDVHTRFCNHLDVEERAGCFSWFVLLVSQDCWVALPPSAWVCLQFVIVVFPGHTHLLFLNALGSSGGG